MKIYTHTIGSINYTIKIGQNAKENWELIDNSEPFDLWFHLDNYPSSHVIISQNLNSDPEIFYPNQIIALAADYCKTHSKKKSTTKVKIVYTQVQNITKGKEVGSVFVSDEKYIFV
jgi:predicted ribosome quality control (RQC) complex YloA/Tae2 family protein